MSDFYGELSARLLALAQNTDVIVAVDDYQNVTELSTAFQAAGAKLNTIVEVDLGMRRCGVEPGQAALSLAKHVEASPGACDSAVLWATKVIYSLLLNRKTCLRVYGKQWRH